MKIERMLVAVDFSETSTRAAQWVCKRFAPDAELTLVHVIDLPRRPPFASADMPSNEDIEATAREFATTHMHELATYLTSGVVRLDIRVGKPYEEIARVAIETRANLVVIGPHGDRPRRSRFLGTTADHIARTCPVPVLVATNPPTGAPQRILAPIDDSAATPAVLAWTKSLAEQYDADVTLLHVWSNAVYSHVASMSYATARTDKDAREEIDKELAEAAAYWLGELARTGLARERVTASIKYGHAGDVVIETAESTRADLIVLGRRGSGLLAPALLGSTVATVLHEARCPILVIAEGTSV